jgi:hypothetical protein
LTVLGGIEAGGTKWRCAVGAGPNGYVPALELVPPGLGTRAGFLGALALAEPALAAAGGG